LARPADAIFVAEVYTVVGEPLFPKPTNGPDNPPHCAIERSPHATMHSALAPAEAVLRADLAHFCIADLAKGMVPQP
jgi:DNA-binding IscR family transcriptional regulator